MDELYFCVALFLSPEASALVRSIGPPLSSSFRRKIELARERENPTSEISQPVQ